MRMKFWVSSLFLLAGCASAGKAKPPRPALPRSSFTVQTGLRIFHQYAAQYGAHPLTKGLVIQFDKQPGPGDWVIGVCDIFPGKRRVLLNSTFWDGATHLQRELVLFHELGHCTLNREHRKDYLPDGKPASIMYPSLMDEWTFQGHKAYYLRELFTHK